MVDLLLGGGSPLIAWHGAGIVAIDDVRVEGVEEPEGTGLKGSRLEMDEMEKERMGRRG